LQGRRCRGGFAGVGACRVRCCVSRHARLRGRCAQTGRVGLAARTARLPGWRSGRAAARRRLDRPSGCLSLRLCGWLPLSSRLGAGCMQGAAAQRQSEPEGRPDPAGRAFGSAWLWAFVHAWQWAHAGRRVVPFGVGGRNGRGRRGSV
jgi:hypothetical protein